MIGESLQPFQMVEKVQSLLSRRILEVHDPFFPLGPLGAQKKPGKDERILHHFMNTKLQQKQSSWMVM